MVKFDSTQFHVIDPVILLIDVGRDDAHRLGIARIIDAHLEGVGGLGCNLGCKLGIIGLQHLCTQGEIACKLARCAGRAHGGVHELAALLWLAVDVIDGSAVVGSPAVVGRIVLGQFHADVVTVIGNLIIQFALVGVHFAEPREAPIDLVDDVGNTVGALNAVSLEMVTECPGALLPGQHHLVDGVGARGGVLQQVGCVMPATAHVDALTLLVGVIAHVGILDVAAVALERVVSAPLLAHVVEHKVGRSVPHTIVDGENG